MTRTILKRTVFVLAGLIGLLAVVIGLAAVTDRPDAEPVVVERDDPDVAAFLAAERAWMDHHGLDYTEHVVELGEPGLRVRVLDVGEGSPVLFLPASAGEAARYAPLLGELDGYRVLAVNLPGGGASDGVDLRAVDHRALARETLDAVYDDLGLDAVPIVGASIGGTWALWYGLDRPDRVTASAQLGVPMALEGTTVPTELGVLGVPGLNRIAASTLMPAAGPEDAGQAFEQGFGHPGGTAEALPGVAREFEYALQQLPTFELSWRSLGEDAFSLAGLGDWAEHVEISLDGLSNLAHPNLLVWPSNDPFGDLEVGREVVAQLPDAELRVAGIGHLPWLDDPEGVADLITEFLDAAPAGGPRP